MAFFVIDGLNICREEHPTRLTGLLSLLLEIKRRGDDLFCFFDQDAFRIFVKGRPSEDVEAKVYKQMTNIRSTYSKYFAQVRGKADKKILDFANNNPECVVISNDNYAIYKDEFPWLKNTNRCVNEVSVFRGRIMCEQLNIALTENKDLAGLWSDLKKELDGNAGRSGRSSKGKTVEAQDDKPVRMKKCVKCGHLFDKSLRFCPTDGESLIRATTADLSEETYITNKSKKQKPMDIENGSNVDSPIIELLKLGMITEEIAEVLQYGIDEEPTRLLTDHTEMVALVTVIDKSGSMKKHKKAVIDGQHHMFNALLGASPSAYDIRLAQILFNDKVEYFQRFGKFRDDSDPHRTHREVKILDETTYQPEGFTALYDATLQGICALTPLIHWSRQEGIALESRVGILTDGLDEGELGSGSKIPPKALRKVIDFMVPKLVNRIILVGIGDFDYAGVGKEIGISEVISLSSDPKSIRRAFELFSSR